MKIEEGKYYRTREGEKIGPIWVRGGLCGPFGDREGWYEDGRRSLVRDSPLDLVAEWADEPPGPVRTVTRKEIVRGEFGGVVIEEHVGEIVHLRMLRTTFDKHELRAAAATLTEIADALGEAS